MGLRCFPCKAAVYWQFVAENFKTGWSSIAFGATPVCPCGMSKNPTPVNVAEPVRWRKSLDGGDPHLAISFARAFAIAAFLGEDAAPLQVVSGNSVIIVFAGLPGADTTR